MLKVPFSQKDAAKAMGAKWDPKARSWYAPAGLAPEDRQALLDRWGENAGDVGMGTVELVNALARYTADADGLLPGEAIAADPSRVDIPPVPVKINAVVVEWPLLRRHVSDRRGGTCENPACPQTDACENPACPQTGKPERLLVQPLWTYDDEHLVQRLKGLAALCPECYYGPGRGLVRRLDNGEVCTDVTTSEALRTWIARMAPRGALRDAVEAPRWRVDLTLLTRAGFAVSGIPG